MKGVTDHTTLVHAQNTTLAVLKLIMMLYTYTWRLIYVPCNNPCQHLVHVLSVSAWLGFELSPQWAGISVKNCSIVYILLAYLESMLCTYRFQKCKVAWDSLHKNTTGQYEYSRATHSQWVASTVVTLSLSHPPVCRRLKSAAVISVLLETL